METKIFQYAGFWRRYSAAILDGALIIFFTNSARWALADTLRFHLMLNMEYSSLEDFMDLIWFFYLIIIRWTYFTGMESSPFRATFGKMALGLYVTDQNGERIDFGQATGRYFGKILSGLILGIGYLMAGFTEKHQALHDKLSNSLVLRK